MSKKSTANNNYNNKTTVLDKIKNGYNTISVPSHFEINGNREVNVDGYRELLEYSDANIKVNMNKLIVSFSGRGLSIKCLDDTSMLICGYITNIEFIT